MARSRTISMISHRTAESIGDYAVFDPVEYRLQRQQLSNHRCTRLCISSIILLAFGFLIGGLFAQQMEREIVVDDDIQSEVITNIFLYQVIVKDTHPSHTSSATLSLSVCSKALHSQYYGALGAGIVAMILTVICFIISVIGFNGTRMNERPIIFFLPCILFVIFVLDVIVLSLSVSPLQWDSICPGAGGSGGFRLGGGAGTFIVSLFFNFVATVISGWQALYLPSPGSAYKLDKIYIPPARLEEMRENNENGSDPIFSDIPTATSYRFVPANRAISGVSSSAVLVRDENVVHSASNATSVFSSLEGLDKDRRTCYKNDLRRTYLPPNIDQQNDLNDEYKMGHVES